MSNFKKGDSFYLEQNDGDQAELYYIDEFSRTNKETGNEESFIVAGGAGEEVLFVPKEKIVKNTTDTIEQKILNVLVDISRNLKYNTEVLETVASFLIPDSINANKDADEFEEDGEQFEIVKKFND